MSHRKHANDNSPNSAPVFLTLAQVADRWQVHPRTVRRIIDKGELIRTVIGGQLRIAMPDLIAYERLHRLGEVA